MFITCIECVYGNIKSYLVPILQYYSNANWFVDIIIAGGSRDSRGAISELERSGNVMSNQMRI